ncbi:histidine phosphatase family protein [Nocardioides sp.]|uniref:histidine phosphatase family protein n=1 Tax=Nocardioides sp. TaxID=35761 RepID=UPI00286E5557|nr:histidine phosphatase family protein [Nocardioides sp.]
MSRILLVRHGQASWGAADYDQLSTLGEAQSRILGAALATQGITPDVLISGAMKRHGQTARGVCEGAGWELPVTTDEGWNEFDHLQVLARHPAPEGVDIRADPRAFQAWFEAATLRWTGGAHDDYDESFAHFSARVSSALDRTIGGLGPQGTAVVFTSGGPISWAAATRLDGGTHLWLRLNQVVINAAVTSFVVGSRGATLLAFNEHTHLSPDHQTYR